WEPGHVGPPNWQAGDSPRVVSRSISLLSLSIGTVGRVDSATLASCCVPRRAGSVRVGADDLAAVAGAQIPPGLDVDRALEELDTAVAEQDVAAAGVVAGGVGVLAPREAAPRLIQPAAAPGVLLGVGRDDRVEGGHPEPTIGPTETLVVGPHGELLRL